MKFTHVDECITQISTLDTSVLTTPDEKAIKFSELMQIARS